MTALGKTLVLRPRRLPRWAARSPGVTACCWAMSVSCVSPGRGPWMPAPAPLDVAGVPVSLLLLLWVLSYYSITA